MAHFVMVDYSDWMDIDTRQWHNHRGYKRWSS
jgi:hypothetical protein